MQPLDTLFAAGREDGMTASAYNDNDGNEKQGDTEDTLRGGIRKKKRAVTAKVGNNELEIGNNLKVLFGTLPAFFEID